MTDPIQVTILAPADKFFGLTSTAWAAISSLIAAITTIALLIFNWRYLRLTHKQSDAAIKQADLAQSNFDALQKQIADEKDLERHSALAILREASAEVNVWRQRIQLEFRPDASDRAILIPQDWKSVMSFIARRAPDLLGEFHRVDTELRNTEVTLNHVIHVPINSRHPNSSIYSTQESLFTRLDGAKKNLDALETKVRP